MDTDSEDPIDETARTLAYAEAVKLFSFVGLKFDDYYADHEEAAETLVDYFVMNDAQFPDDFPGLGADEPTDDELDAMPEVEPVGAAS